MQHHQQTIYSVDSHKRQPTCSAKVNRERSHYLMRAIQEHFDQQTTQCLENLPTALPYLANLQKVASLFASQLPMQTFLANQQRTLHRATISFNRYSLRNQTAQISSLKSNQRQIRHKICLPNQTRHQFSVDFQRPIRINRQTMEVL